MGVFVAGLCVQIRRPSGLQSTVRGLLLGLDFQPVAPSSQGPLAFLSSTAPSAIISVYTQRVGG